MISANIWNFEDSQLYELSSTACYDIHCCDVDTDVALHTMFLISPQMAYVLYCPVIRPVFSSTCAMLSCTEA